jgi:hypothetical protein
LFFRKKSCFANYIKRSDLILDHFTAMWSWYDLRSIFEQWSTTWSEIKIKVIVLASAKTTVQQREKIQKTFNSTNFSHFHSQKFSCLEFINVAIFAPAKNGDQWDHVVVWGKYRPTHNKKVISSTPTVWNVVGAERTSTHHIPWLL